MWLHRGNFDSFLVLTAASDEQPSTTVSESSLVVLECHGPSPGSLTLPVNWYMWPNATHHEFLVIKGEVVRRFAHSLSLRGSTSLVIHNTSQNNSGIYDCIEDSGFGAHHRQLLLVLKTGKKIAY